MGALAVEANVRRTGDDLVKGIGTWLTEMLSKWRAPSRDKRALVEREWQEAAKRRGQFFVYTDFVDAYTIDPNGSCYFIEGTHPPKPIHDRQEEHRLRWLAAERYPELEHIRPVRTERDVECPDCGGSGRPSVVGPDGAAVCWCGGSGWLPGALAGDARTDA